MICSSVSLFKTHVMRAIHTILGVPIILLLFGTIPANAQIPSELQNYASRQATTSQYPGASYGHNHYPYTTPEPRLPYAYPVPPACSVPPRVPNPPRNPHCYCTLILAPVCGIDGATYGNACEAGCHGVPIAHEGVCAGDYGFSCKYGGPTPPPQTPPIFFENPPVHLPGVKAPRRRYVPPVSRCAYDQRFCYPTLQQAMNQLSTRVNIQDIIAQMRGTLY